MAVTLLDSGSIIGYLDFSNFFHRSAVAEITPASQREDLVASVVTYGEILVGAELGYRDRAIVDTFFTSVISRIEPVDARIARRAAVLRGQRTSLKMPDALILATADLHADRAITTDDQWPKMSVACAITLLSAT